MTNKGQPKPYTIESNEPQLIISMPVNKNPFSVGCSFFSLVLIWGFFFIFSITLIILQFSTPGFVGVGLLLCFSILISIPLSLFILWNLFARETIIFDEYAMVVSDELLGIGRSIAYRLEDVENIGNPTTEIFFDFFRSYKFNLGINGTIEFDYQGRRYSMAPGLFPEDRHKLAREINDWLARRKV